MDKRRILYYRIIPRIKQDQTKFDFCFESKVDQEQKWTLKCDQHTYMITQLNACKKSESKFYNNNLDLLFLQKKISRQTNSLSDGGTLIVGIRSQNSSLKEERKKQLNLHSFGNKFIYEF